MEATSAEPRVIFDEGRLVVVDKPEGLSSEDTAQRLSRRLVHRIDKATSGLLVLGDDARAVRLVQRALRAGLVRREYLFVAHGVVGGGRLESVLVRDRGDGLRGSPLRGCAEGGKRAAMLVEPLLVGDDGRATLGRATLETGRTHQVRIQLAERGHPLVGEPVYVRDLRASGGAPLSSPRLLLHAWRLSFVHPATKRAVDLRAAPPASFVDAAARVLGASPDAIAAVVG